MIVGEKLEELIEMGIAKGFIHSKKWLAEDVLGVTESAMYRWFKAEDVKMKYVLKICEIVGVSTDQFFGTDDPKSLVAEPAGIYKPKTESLVKDLGSCKQELEKARLEISHYKEQLKMKDEMIALLRSR